LAKLQDELAPRGVVIVGMCDDTADAQRKLTDPAGVSYPLLVEPDNPPAPFDGVKGFPSFLVVDREGRIVGPVFARSRTLLLAAIDRADSGTATTDHR
jgi:peroxiredoxin